MSFLGFNINQYRLYALGFVLMLMVSCKKDPEPIFELNEVFIEESGVNKPNVKSAKAYISIAYQDIFEQSIPNNLLNSLINIYISFGDTEVINELMIKNFLKDENAKVPSEEEMRADIETFVTNAFNQYYNRAPNEQELWFFSNKIEENNSITPDAIHFALLTSLEYQKF